MQNNTAVFLFLSQQNSSNASSITYSIPVSEVISNLYYFLANKNLSFNTLVI